MPTDTPRVKPPRRAKRHRACYFWPIWRQHRLPSQAAYDMRNWGESGCQGYVSEGPDHPRYTRAVAALAALDEAKGRLQAAKEKLTATLAS